MTQSKIGDLFNTNTFCRLRVHCQYMLLIILKEEKYVHLPNDINYEKL